MSLGCDSTADVPCFDGSEDAKDSCTFPLEFALCFPHSYAKVMGLEKKDLSYFERIYTAIEKGMREMKWGKSGIDEESVGRSICFWTGCGQH